MLAWQGQGTLPPSVRAVLNAQISQYKIRGSVYINEFSKYEVWVKKTVRKLFVLLATHLWPVLVNTHSDTTCAWFKVSSVKGHSLQVG